MTLSRENSNLVWQKVKIATETFGTDPAIVSALRAIKEKLAGVGGNPNLQFIPINATDVDDAAGKVLADVPATLVAVYLKKQATATATFLALLDDDTDDASPITDVQAVIGLNAASQEAYLVYPDGQAYAVGMVAKAYTEFDGTTDAADTDTPNGFVIIRAA